MPVVFVRTAAAVVLIWSASAGLAGPVAAQTVAEFYKDKTITAIVPFGAGGGYAIYTQVMARHLPRFIPGQPSIVPQFMPGAGGIVASNHIANLARRDGTVMATVSDSVVLASVIDADKVKYNVNDFIWIGAIERVNNVLAVRADTGVKRFEDMNATEIVHGASGPGSPTSLLPSLLRWLVPSIKLKTVEGYPGISQMFVALESREVSAMTVSWTIFKSLKKEWFEQGTLLPIVQFGSTKEKDLAAVPLAVELAVTPEQKAVARFMASNVDVGRSFILPPQVPADRVEALRAAFDKMVIDPLFMAELDKAGFQLSPASGREVQDAVAQASKIDHELADVIRKVIAKAQ